MKAIIKEEKKDMLVVEIEGARHTLPNILREQLWNYKGVEFVGYSKDHPDLGNPVLVIRGEDPKKSLKSAIKDLRSQIKEMRTKVEKAFK